MYQLLETDHGDELFHHDDERLKIDRSAFKMAVHMMRAPTIAVINPLNNDRLKTTSKKPETRVS